MEEGGGIEPLTRRSRQLSKLIREPTHAPSEYVEEGGGIEPLTPKGHPGLASQLRSRPRHPPHRIWSRLSESNRLISPLPRECSPTLLKRHCYFLHPPAMNWRLISAATSNREPSGSTRTNVNSPVCRTVQRSIGAKLDAPVGIEPTSSPSKGADLPLAEGALGWSGWSSRTSITNSITWMPEQGSNLHFRIQSRATCQLVDRAIAPRLRGDRRDSNPPSPAPQAGASSLSASATPKPWNNLLWSRDGESNPGLLVTKELIYH